MTCAISTGRGGHRFEVTPMSAISHTDRLAEPVSDATRWSQLIIGIVCMVMIANLQYGWSLFTIPIAQKFGWSLASIQVAFTLFVLFETWLVPLEGYLVDRFGPRIVVFVGGCLAGLAWVLNSIADSLAMLYLDGGGWTDGNGPTQAHRQGLS